jgi:DnaJ homolog subfamily C member 8
LTQAESELSDSAKREALDATIAEARLQLLRSHGFSTSTQDDDPKLRTLIPPFKLQLRAKAKDLLIEEEVRRRKWVTFLVKLHCSPNDLKFATERLR